jgi:aspartate oxidase
LIQEYDRQPDAPFSSHPLETYNLLCTSKYVVEGAISRQENVGLHYNTDLVSV